MSFVNLTGHRLCFYDEEGDLLFVLPPSGSVTRVVTTAEPAGDIGGMPLSINKIVTIDNLPDPQERQVFIVSSFVLTALSIAGQARPDVVAPDTAPGRCVRYTEEDSRYNPEIKVGAIKGVKGFQSQPMTSPAEFAHQVQPWLPQRRHEWTGEGAMSQLLIAAGPPRSHVDMPHQTAKHIGKNRHKHATPGLR